jgi:hypothetical protein
MNLKKQMLKDEIEKNMSLKKRKKNNLGRIFQT